MTSFYRNDDDVRAAVDYFEKALKLAPSQITVRRCLADLFSRLGHDDQALRVMQRVPLNDSDEVTDRTQAIVAPWLKLLEPHAFVQPTSRSSTRPQTVDSIVEHISCVCIRFCDVEKPNLFHGLPHDVDRGTIVALAQEEERLRQEMRVAALLTPAQLRSVRDAMEIVGRAFVLAPPLWAAFSVHVRCPDRIIEPLRPRAFREEDLTSAFELVYDHESVEFATWLQYVDELLSPNVPSNASADATKRQLQVMERAHGVDATLCHSVDVSLRVAQCADATLADLATVLESVCGQRSATPGSRAVIFRVTHIDLCVSGLNDAVVDAMTRIRALGIDVRELDVLKDDRITNANAHKSLAMLAQSPATSDELSCGGLRSFVCRLPDANSAGPSLVNAVLLDPRCPTTVVVDDRFTHTDGDWLLLCRVLQVAFARSHPRDRFRFQYPSMEAQSVTELQAALATIRVAGSPWYEAQLDSRSPLGKSLLAEHGIPNGTPVQAIPGRRNAMVCLPPQHDWIQVPIRTLKRLRQSQPLAFSSDGTTSVGISTGWCSGAAALQTVLTWLSVCFPVGHLTSLDLLVVSGAKFTRAMVEQILVMCPQLRSLELSHAEADVMSAVVDGYRSGSCRLEVLAIEVCGVTFLPLIEELARLESAAARTLREVKVGFPQHDEDAFLCALTNMLTANRTLEFVEVVVFAEMTERPDPVEDDSMYIIPTDQSMELTESIAAALRPFHRKPLAGVAAARRLVPLRVKQAFISAVNGRPLLGRRETQVGSKRNHTGAHVAAAAASSPRRWNLDRGVLATILAFAAPCLLRLVSLKMRISCHDGRHARRRYAAYKTNAGEDAIEL